jgi:hypothetical protein
MYGWMGGWIDGSADGLIDITASSIGKIKLIVN